MPVASAAFGAAALDDRGENIREDLRDEITMISPTERPFTANAGEGTASSDFHEWLRDELATASAANAHVDGDDFGTNVTGDNTDPAFRLGNALQISKKQIKITRRADIVDTAGRATETAYQIAKKGKELARDVESALLANQAVVFESGSTAARCAGLPAWLRTNDVLEAAGSPASPTLNNTTYGYPDAARTDGTLRALSEADLLGVVRDCYLAGGEDNMIMMYPTVKALFSAYYFATASARAATPYQDHGKTPREGVTMVGGVGTYVSDFGIHDVVPNRFQRTRDVFVLDMAQFEVVYLDGYKVERLAKSGDSERYHLLVDYTLKSCDEAASGMVAGVSTTLAMVA